MDDDDDFRAWVVAVSPRLLRTATLLTGDPHTAHDLVQNTLIRVWPRWSQVRVGHPDSYARTVMRRLQASAFHRKWRGEIPTEHLPEVAALSADPLGDLALRQALARLPLSQRTIVVLRYVEDLAVSEVARICECSEGNVKSQSARGLQKLKALMSTTEE